MILCQACKKEYTKEEIKYAAANKATIQKEKDLNLAWSVYAVKCACGGAVYAESAKFYKKKV